MAILLKHPGVVNNSVPRGILNAAMLSRVQYFEGLKVGVHEPAMFMCTNRKQIQAYCVTLHVYMLLSLQRQPSNRNVDTRLL